MTQHISSTLSHMWATLNTMANGSAVGKFLLGLGSMVVGYFAPIWYLLLICFAATFIDMIYGFKVARKFK